MTTLKQIFQFTLNSLQQHYDKFEALSLTYIIFEKVLDLNKVEIALNFDKTGFQKFLPQINSIIEKLKNYTPIQYIFKEAYCYGFKFIVDFGVFIPRPETELLIDYIINDENFSKAKKILDIGTGSGCIAIILKKLSSASVYAIDINPKALNVAKKNAEIHNVKINFKKSDILKNPNFSEKFDIIVSNPPYIPENKKSLVSPNVLFEPPDAIFVSSENPLIFYEKILNSAEKILNPNGKIYFEIYEDLAQQTYQLAKNKNFEAKILFDLNNNPKFLKIWKNVRNY